MKKLIILPVLFILACCSQKSKTEDINPEISKKDSVSVKTESKTSQEKKTNKLLVGTKIEGDFDGDGKNEFATVTKTKQGEGNPIEYGTPDEYTISFSNSSLKAIPINCCEATLINEGDLNNDGKDDFSAFQAPMNGCTYTMTTYSLQNSEWKQIVETFSVPTGCDGFTAEDLQNSIFIKNKTVYKMERNPNDESLKLIRKKIELK